MRVYESSTDGTGMRLALVVSRFNHLVCVRLLEGCVAELVRRGVSESNIHVAWVPGAFEIPQAARALAASGRYDAIVTLGAVIRGDTPHFEYVCEALTHGIRDVIRETELPVAFGVLTTDDADQALARAGGDLGNKGEEAAIAAVEMVHLLRAISKEPRSRS